MPPRKNIIQTFAEWTAFSASRSGCPIKAREDVYPLVRLPDYNFILGKKTITQEEFDSWHKESTLKIHEKDNRILVGWATKLINVYLKTSVYLAGEGCPDLVECIHPPIDSGLWRGIKSAYKNNPEIINKTHIVSRIKDIIGYNTHYKTIIEGCRLIAQNRKCYLIEVEELWQPDK